MARGKEGAVKGGNGDECSADASNTTIENGGVMDVSYMGYILKMKYPVAKAGNNIISKDSPVEFSCDNKDVQFRAEYEWNEFLMTNRERVSKPSWSPVSYHDLMEEFAKQRLKGRIVYHDRKTATVPKGAVL